jgi:hypothetical protein
MLAPCRPVWDQLPGRRDLRIGFPRNVPSMWIGQEQFLFLRDVCLHFRV